MGSDDKNYIHDVLVPFLTGLVTLLGKLPNSEAKQYLYITHKTRKKKVGLFENAL